MNGIKWGRVDLPPDKQPLRNVVIVASGPSAELIDFTKLKGVPSTYIITVNGAGEHVPFADAWFTLDPWGLHTTQTPDRFKGKLYAAVPEDYGTPHAKVPNHRNTPKNKITFLHRLQSHNYTTISSDTAYKLGLSDDKSCINTGNSGYGALNLAYHLSPERIFLVGIDGSSGYFYDKKKKTRPLTYLPLLFNSAVPQLEQKNIKVYNVSSTSVIQSFKKITPAEFYSFLTENK